MKKKTVIKVCMSLLVLFGSLGVSQGVLADSTPLSVKAILPENQYDKDVSYYSLMMKAGQEQEIDLQLFNSSDVDATAVVTLTAATTNDNGLIDYSLPEKDLSKKMLHPFTEIAKSPKEVLVPAKKDVITKVTIKMPPEEYSGMILGGINVTTKKNEATADSKQTGGMQIENEMNYAIGVVLLENLEAVKTDLTLERVYASQVMSSNTMKATLENPTMAVMEDVTIEAKIYAKGSDKELYGTKKSGYRMAPTSYFDFGIPLGTSPYQAGDYRIKILATSEPKDPKDGEKQTWELENDFTIKRSEADKLNKSAVGLEKDNTMWYIVGGILATVVMVLIIFATVILTNRKQRQKAEKTKKRRRVATKSNNGGTKK